MVDDGVFKETFAQPFRDTFKSEAQTFLDAARLDFKGRIGGRYPQTKTRAR